MPNDPLPQSRQELESRIADLERDRTADRAELERLRAELAELVSPLPDEDDDDEELEDDDEDDDEDFTDY